MSSINAPTTRGGRLRGASLLGALALVNCAPSAPDGPDLILTGGSIYPSGSADLRVEAIAVQGDRIAAVGTDAEIRALTGEDTQEMELDGAVVLPGFFDAWIDLEAVGRWSAGLDLRRTATPREVQARLREALAQSSEEWVIGWGWDESIWPRPELPGHDLLDAVDSNRALVMLHQSNRLAWLNTVAMERSGLTNEPGILRDAAGEWTGVVSGTALAALQAVLPSTDESQRTEWMIGGVRAAAAAGVTTAATAPLDTTGFRILARLQRDDELPIRVLVRLSPETLADLDLSAIPDSLRPLSAGRQLDGPIGPRLASLTSPYADSELALDTAPLEDRASTACETAAAAGVSVDFQAHGDAAALAAIECTALRNGEGLLIGVDLLPEAGAEALGDARVVAVPTRMTHDMYVMADRVGEGRLDRAFAFRTLFASGHLVGLASIAPYYALAPMESVRATWQRQDRDGYPIDSWAPQERLSVGDAIRLAIGRVPGITAELAPGSRADLVVWSHDPFVDSESALRQTRAMVTIVGGHVVYSRPLVNLPFERD